MLKSAVESRPMWSTPKLEELGNLRTLVRVGVANGKSGVLMDGGASAGCEAMFGGDGCMNSTMSR